jgi:hypothetical protein
LKFFDCFIGDRDRQQQQQRVWRAKGSVDLGLGPGRERRQRRQDRLDIAAGVEPELGAAVVEQVE